MRSPERYRALSGSTGIDIDITERFGAGAQYSLIHEQQGADGTEFLTHTGNFGAGFLVLPFVSLDARYGTRYSCDGLSIAACDLDREHRFYLTLRAAVGALRGAAGRP